MNIKYFISLARELAKLTVAITWLLKALAKLVGMASNYPASKGLSFE